MIKKPSRTLARVKRHMRIRKKISGTAEMPRLAVFRSNKHIYAQIIDDVKAVTLCAASTVEKEVAGSLKSASNKEAAAAVGKAVAAKAKAVATDAGGVASKASGLVKDAKGALGK